MSSLIGRSGESSDPEPLRFASIGLATLLDLFDSSRREVAGLLEAAIVSIDHDVALLTRAAAVDDRPGIIAEAHRIKGTSGSIGARAVTERSSQIESTVTRSDAKITPVMLDELRGAVDRVRQDIADYIAHPHPS